MIANYRTDATAYAFRLVEMCVRCGFRQGNEVCACLDRYGDRKVILFWDEVR